MEYHGMEYSIFASGGKWGYEIPEIGLEQQNKKPFSGGEMNTAEQAQIVARAHIDIIVLERQANSEVTQIVAGMEAEKIRYLEIIEKA